MKKKKKAPLSNRYFIYHLKDSYGNLVDYVICESKLQKLVDKHPIVISHLRESGFTPVKGSAYNKEKVVIDGFICPKCGKDISDNREAKAAGTINPKYPDFSCLDREGCNWAVWAGQYEVKGEEKKVETKSKPKKGEWKEEKGIVDDTIPF